MQRTELNEKALKGASSGAEKAFNAAFATELAAVSYDEKVAWAMAAIIHCDQCRLIVAYDECELEGIARLLWMADIVSKLHEAKRWYFKTGCRLLLDIATTKNCGQEYVQKAIKEIKSNHPISGIDEYADYRNKFGYHYDVNALSYLDKFAKENADLFFKRLRTFSRFSAEWISLTRSLIANELPHPGTSDGP
jgi:predicted Zn-ribbon and HTH transcriptional regulator